VKPFSSTRTKRHPPACLAFAIMLATGIPACQHDRAQRDSGGQQKASGPAAAVQTATYHGVGVVKRLDPKRPSIEIDHEDIKDLMPAMTMEFYVKDKSLLDGLKPSDRIAFTIENGVGGVKITEIKKR
jgi:Cu/Ag efflux protein CusF